MSAKTDLERQKSSDAYRLLCGTCPDEECQAKLYFPSYDKSIECTNCGQRHEKSLLQNVAEVTNPSIALHNLLKNILLGNVKPKKGADNVKVLGLSNYVCKLTSPILTSYGMDRKAGKARLLKEMGQGEVFNCGRILGDRVFLIEEENLDVIGYGKDRSGSIHYLADTLNDIRAFNDNETRLIPIHADGDGHCLVHAISRALVGRELFWHALRVNLGIHLRDNLATYKQLFKDFIDADEWGDIIDECDPYYIPPEGEPIGLRNIHIFGLANVLHRPIILLDSKSGMQSSGDYSGVFVPGLVAPEECRGKDGSMNKPLCIAWSSYGRNHYIPLVGIKGRGPAMLPAYMVQKAWGMPKESIKDYLELDSKFRCVVGGDKCLTDRYIRQLVGAMEEVFIEQYQVNPTLVADVHQYIYKSSGIVGVQPYEVILRTQKSIEDQLLYRCLTCEALEEYHLDRDLFERGGSLYNLAVSVHKTLNPDKLYSFPTQGAVCSYDAEKDCLIPDMTKSHPKTCAFCSGEMLRLVKSDGSILYKDGDRTTTPCVGGKCPCGFKHFWNGKEYDNLPEVFPISLQWTGKMVSEKVAWFQYETDPTMNSNVFEVAQAVVQKHFPGEFGSERLVQQVVDTILGQTASAAASQEDVEEKVDPEDAWSAETATKIILTGHARKSVHKEQLVKSEKEKDLRKKIQANAPKVQQRKTAELHRQSQLPPKATAPKDSKVTSPPAAQASEPVASSSTYVPSSDKKVKLATSDGRQAMLTLVNDVTYEDLQKLIFVAVDVPADRQRIRLGFPPKVLEPPKEGAEDSIIPLKHGDKIALEILQHQQSQPANVLPSQPAGPSGRSSWGSFEENTQNQTADSLLQTLKSVQHHGDSIDTSIASLGILCAVSGKDMWTSVQSMPHLFSVGGLLYQQVQRDLGLVDGKHCQLPSLPGKVFRYNANQDRLEICLEPYGHFPVEPHIEQKVMEQGLQRAPDTATEVNYGFSGAIHHGHDHKAFSGQGHSLKEVEERMPTDLACASLGPQVRGLHNLCPAPGQHEDSIEEEPDEAMQVDSHNEESQSEPTYQRLGPGYSVIDRAEENRTNANIEMFRALAESIEKTYTEDADDQHDPVMDLYQSVMATQASIGATSQQSVAMETQNLPGDDATANLGEEKQKKVETQGDERMSFDAVTKGTVRDESILSSVVDDSAQNQSSLVPKMEEVDSKNSATGSTENTEHKELNQSAVQQTIDAAVQKVAMETDAETTVIGNNKTMIAGLEKISETVIEEKADSGEVSNEITGMVSMEMVQETTENDAKAGPEKGVTERLETNVIDDTENSSCEKCDVELTVVTKSDLDEDSEEGLDVGVDGTVEDKTESDIKVVDSQMPDAGDNLDTSEAGK